MLDKTAIRNTAARFWRSDWGPLIFVWGIWALMASLLIDFVNIFGVDCPFYDEWEMVPALTGGRRITLHWLWSQHNEHRIFIPRLIYLAVTRLTHGDFRAGMYFDAVAMMASAATLILLARHLRKRTEYTDAFFPLILLNLGQAENLINSFQIAFLSGTLLSVAALSLSWLPQLSFRAAVALGICVFMMPLVGGHGLAFVPALSVTVVIAGWNLRRAPQGTRKMLIVWGIAALALALMAFYFVGYKRPGKHPLMHNPLTIFHGSVQFLTMGLGAAARIGWPATEIPLLIVAVATLAGLIWVVMRQSEQRGRALRVLIFLGGMFCLALGVSRARTALSSDVMFSSRYTSLVAPFWCALYIAWDLVDAAQVRRFAQATLLFCASAFAVMNRQVGGGDAIYFRDVRQHTVDNIKNGMKVGEVVDRSEALYYGDRGVLANYMRALRDKKIGVFAQIKE